jgi:hypothetical protein
MRNIWKVGLCSILSIVLIGCASFPGDGDGKSPRCLFGGQPYFGPQDSDGDGIPDGIGGGIKWLFVTACAIPDEDLGVIISTIPSGSSRIYQIRVTEGPHAGKTYTAKDVYDAISVMDQIFAINNYDMNYQQTSDYRDACKDWILTYFMTPSTFHSTYDY